MLGSWGPLAYTIKPLWRPCSVPEVGLAAKIDISELLAERSGGLQAGAKNGVVVPDAAVAAVALLPSILADHAAVNHKLAATLSIQSIDKWYHTRITMQFNGYQWIWA